MSTGRSIEDAATMSSPVEAAAKLPLDAGAGPAPFPPIGDLGFLSDGEVAALVASSGNVEWLCLPGLDSPSVFGALLDRAAGRFRVSPAGAVVPAGQRYLLASMVIETTWMTQSGLLMVRDALTLGPWKEERRVPQQRRPPGDTQAEHVLLRTLKCVHGSVEVTMECEPMLEYGRLPVQWSYAGPGYGSAIASAPGVELTLRLDGSFRLGFEGGRAAGRTILRESDRAFVALSWGDAVPPADVAEAFERVERTSDHWRHWVSRGKLPDHAWRAVLHRSALTLKALTYVPTGAVAAAATTSLPRVPGESRNWDYRYSFVRDSAWALRALHALGFAWEADDFLAFLVDATAGERPLQNLWRVSGEDPPEEIELPHLGGYAGARPVRVGNAAARYAQHDVWGALVDAAAIPALARGRMSSTVWAMVQRQLDDAVVRWREPDHGVWSLREEPRHYTISKVMCWVAAARGARLASMRGRPEKAREWRATAADIARDVLEHGVSSRGRFKVHYDSDELDAALLLMPLVGFLPGDDPRVRLTVLGVEEELMSGGLVLRRRPRPDEPVAGQAFAVCSWWLVGALVTIGEVDRARSFAERLLSYASPLGLYAEHLDPASGRLLGNFPHALTHLALIDAVLRLIHAESAA